MAKDESYPKKYWWVVVVAVPITVALIAAFTDLLKSDTPGIVQNIDSHNSTDSHDTYNVTNVTVIAREYEAQTGRPLDPDVKRQIEQAVDAARKNDHAESIRLFEQLAASVPVPAVYNNLGVEYKKVQNAEASQKAFEMAKAKIAETKAGADTSSPLPATALKAPPVSGPSIRTESSSVPAMVIEPLSPPYEAPGEIHVVDHGTATAGSYQVKYKPTPGTPVVVSTGTYDVLLKSSSGYGAGFIVASNVPVKEGTLTRINPNALVGGIAVEPLARKGFPSLKQLQVVDRGSGDKRLLAQASDKLGVTLALAPGSYEIVGTTTDNQNVIIVDKVDVKAGSIARIDTANQLAAIIVHTPSVKTELKAVYALMAGTNRIASKVDAFDKPLLVSAGQAYDVGLEQAAGFTPIKKGIVPKPGELVNIQ